MKFTSYLLANIILMLVFQPDNIINANKCPSILSFYSTPIGIGCSIVFSTGSLSYTEKILLGPSDVSALNEAWCILTTIMNLIAVFQYTYRVGHLEPGPVSKFPTLH